MDIYSTEISQIVLKVKIVLVDTFMKAIVELVKNGDLTSKVILSDNPFTIPKMPYKSTDKLELKARYDNDTTKTNSIRIEMWVGNDIIKSLGRDMPNHTSEYEEIVLPTKYAVLEAYFKVVPRDDDATIAVPIQVNYNYVVEHMAKLVKQT